MRRARGFFLFGNFLLAACSVEPKETAGTADSGDASTTAGSSTGGTVTASSTTAPTSESATGSTGGATTTAGGSTAATAATTTIDPSTGGATTAVDPTATSGDTDTGGVDLCVPTLFADSCVTDDDCTLAGDCCSCQAYNPMFGFPGNCGGGCQQDKCGEWGFTEAACEGGHCVVQGKSCNADTVTCNDQQPACPGPDMLPQIVDGCYTGACLPLAACDWVPDCSLCADGTVCVITEGPGCTHRRCVEAFVECEGLPFCDCLGQAYCSPPHDQCSEDQGALVCSL